MIKYDMADLFAGVGGVAQAFANAGFNLKWSNEIDKNACITYRENFNHTLIEGDIAEIDPKKVDDVNLIAAGFPCQAFSIAGHRKGFDDARGTLFFEVMRLVRDKNPEVIFLENVKNLLTHDKGQTFSVISDNLEKAGYQIKYKVMNTCEYSEVPQTRERVYIVCFKNTKHFDKFEFPEKVNSLKTMQEVLDKKVDDKYYYQNSIYYPTLKKEMHNRDTFYQWRRVYLRENKKGLCPTLTANMGTGGHNVPLIKDHKDIRKLTPRECFRLQGFPDTYKFPPKLANGSLYKQAGNSVTVPVIEAIAKNIYKAISDK